MPDNPPWASAPMPVSLRAVAAAMDHVIALAAGPRPTPFSAALLDVASGAIVADACNSAEDGDPTAHAELNLLQDAARRRLDVSGCVMVTTAECCPMCAAAAGWSGVAGIAFGTSVPTLVHLGVPQYPMRLREVLSGPGFGAVPVQGGVRESECDELFARWASSAPGGMSPRRPGLDSGRWNTASVTAGPAPGADGIAAATAFYRGVLGVRGVSALRGTGGNAVPVQVLIGDCVLRVQDGPSGRTGGPPSPQDGATVTFTYYTDDLDGVVARALAAGAALESPPAVTRGGRYVRLTDPAGYLWTVIVPDTH